MMCFSAIILMIICNYTALDNGVALIIWICISVISLIVFTIIAMENGDF